MPSPKTADFRKAILDKFAHFEKENLNFIDLCSGDVHHELGYYPGPNNRMPACCNAMYSLMALDDKIIKAPRKGKGASLVIRYRLPRTSLTSISNFKNINAKPDLSNDSFKKEFERICINYPDMRDLNLLNQIVRIKPRLAIVEIRAISEQLARKICGNEGISTKSMTFGELCGHIKYKGILDPETFDLLDTLRIAGNIAAHDRELTFSEEDAIAVMHLLWDLLRSLNFAD